MAQDFRNSLVRVTQSAIALWTGGDYDVIIGIMLCNQDTDDNVIDVYIANGGTNYFIAKSLSLPAKSSVQLLTGGAKLVLKNGDVLYGDLTTGNDNDTHAVISAANPSKSLYKSIFGISTISIPYFNFILEISLDTSPYCKFKNTKLNTKRFYKD